MASAIQEQLAQVAAFLQELRPSVAASVMYDMASDALVWSDELPAPGVVRVRDLWCLRPVLRYRTTVMLGEPDRQHEDVWNAAQRLFPNWTGFATCRQSTELAKIYTALRAETVSRLAGLPD